MPSTQYSLNQNILDHQHNPTTIIIADLHTASEKFPAAAEELSGFLCRFEESAKNWQNLAQGSRLHSDQIFNQAIDASSWATVACMLAVKLQSLSGLEYATTEEEKPFTPPAVRSFAIEVNRLLDGMYQLSTQLRDSDESSWGLFSACLQQALYLCNLGVQVTCPNNNIYHHQDAHKWFSLRASVRRAMKCGALTGVAQQDEHLALLYRGN